MITQNKGEWSELYVFIKLLSDGILYGADSNLEKIKDLYFPLTRIIRTENGNMKFYEKHDSKIKIITEDNIEILSMGLDEFTQKANELLDAIREAKTSSFSIPTIETFMHVIKCSKIKADSKDKSDITVVLHDPKTQRDETFGFSIKSKLGSPSTLFNAAKSTNFTYEVAGLDKTQITQINEIATPAKLKDRLIKILELGTVTYSEILNPIFEYNLQMVDTNFPIIVAEMLKLYFTGKGKTIIDLTKKLEEINPCKINEKYVQNFYKHKIKTFLTDIALGMTPATPWNGNIQATGGYIIVKESGEILCYHIYNHNEFQNYLFKNTKLDTPSSSRHNFGTIYEKDGKYFLNLNIQIRFI